MKILTRIKFIPAILTLLQNQLTPTWVLADNLDNKVGDTPRPAKSDFGSNLTIRLANESNKPDGVFGPTTYGIRASHSFENEVTIEAAFMRLHEPGSPALSSFVDEAQLTIKAPEFHFLGQTLELGGTAWKNRMIDMYTNLGGLELARKDKVSVSLGLYLGSASREEISSGFKGVQLAISTSLGPVDLALSHLNGRINALNGTSEKDQGFYRKTGLGAATPLPVFQKFPVIFTLDLENRFFSFGTTGPASNPKDEWILITGLEIHFEGKKSL